ncbi:hypothetical protein BHM03_00044890 [Ensete ventricosum]|nr:hypothetical protein BHM03_00044890 [Ensete ventricosum]
MSSRQLLAVGDRRGTVHRKKRAMAAWQRRWQGTANAVASLECWFGLMGRGRGKGKKLTMVTGNEDPGSGGEEVLPTYKRRGRPQKPLKGESDDDDDDETEKIEDEDNVKLTAQSKEIKGSTMVNGKKRNRYSNTKQNSDLVMEETSAGSQSIDEDSTRSNGFRHNGSRRKSKPRRAAEAGVECK